MTNHYHLLVRTPQPNLARGMRDLNGVYAQAFNRRHGRVGHLFQGRYRALLIERDEHLLSAVAYVVRNPVRAGICRTPGEWRWSSHRAVLGECPPGQHAVDELLSYLGRDRARARAAYRDLTELRPEPALLESDRVIYGTDAFTREHLVGVEDSPEIPRSHRRLPRPALATLLQTTTDDAIAAAYAHGYTMPAIARRLDLHPSTISRRLARYRAQIKT